MGRVRQSIISLHANHDHTVIWEEMHQNLQKHFFKHNIKATYNNLLMHGLQQGQHAKILPDPNAS